MDHLDQQTLSALKEVMGNDFSLLINTFLQDSETRLTTLRSLIDTEGYDAIRRAAHSFKGSCSNMGALLLASYCAELESNALNNSVANLDQDVERLGNEFETVKSLLSNF